MSTAAHTGAAPEGALGPVRRGIGAGNPIVYQSLGVCSALAVTNQLDKTLVMVASLTFVATLSCLIVSMLRHWTPHRVRMITQMLVIATLVILVDLYLRSHWMRMRSALGPYLELIITNCLIMGRCEAFASRERPLRAALDGLGASLGYGMVLCAVAAMREPLGSGTLLGHPVFPEGFMPARLAVLAPGAFLAMGLVVWAVKGLYPAAEPEVPAGEMAVD
ncbi:MAG: Rnf-Nqr domain containing protein [Planctomycetota bacterium]